MKKILSLVLVVVLIFSISIVAFAEEPTFSKSFGSYDDMLTYIEQYSLDYPNVEYSNGGVLTIPVKGYELKDKELLRISVDNPEYTMTELSCGETSYNYGINYTHCRFTKNDDTTINLIAYYHRNAEAVMTNVEGIAGMLAFAHEFCCLDGEVHIGDVDGYYYEAFYYSAHNETSYWIAADDVYIEIESTGSYDEEFINSLVIEKSGIEMPVQEISPNAPIKVTDEVLEATRKDYGNEEIEKEDITVTDYYDIGDTKKLVRLTVAGYGYTCDVVEQRIGDYILYVPQRPLPQILVNGTFYDFDEAYDTGIINDENLKTMSKFSSKNYSLTKYEEIYGDVDGDKKVSVIDAAYIQRYLCGYREPDANYQFADYDRDGKITLLDATAIQRKLANL